MFKFLFSVLCFIVDWLSGRKKDTAQELGKSQATIEELQNEIKIMDAEAKAQASAPTKMEDLIAEQKKGEV